MISKKIILLGKFGVGKTSLVRRFVHQKFSDEYLTTIGVKIDKKELDVGGRSMSMIIWDIAGESSQKKIPSGYKLGAHGILYVFDLTRPSSHENAMEDIEKLKKLLPNAPIKLIGNKKDLMKGFALEEFMEKTKLDNVIFSSAKTGENVEDIFMQLGVEML